jgi:hypothetical protein
MANVVQSAGSLMTNVVQSAGSLMTNVVQSVGLQSRQTATQLKLKKKGSDVHSNLFLLLPFVQDAFVLDPGLIHTIYPVEGGNAISFCVGRIIHHMIDKIPDVAVER